MTDKEKAEYYDQWKDYFEPLSKLRKEMITALPYWGKLKGDDLIRTLLEFDQEVLQELKNLIQTMLNEVKSDDT